MCKGNAIMKSINVEIKDAAIVHESKSVTRRRGYSQAADMHRARTASVDSVYTLESDYEADPEILANVRPESPSLMLHRVL